MIGFIKNNRSEKSKRLHERPIENHILNVIAQRVSREGNPVKGVKMGESIVSDYENFGLKRQPMRTALSNLRKWGYITTRATSKATYASLSDSTVYDCNISEPNQQNNQQLTNKTPVEQPVEQPVANHNQEVKKKERRRKKLPLLKIFDLSEAKEEIEKKYGEGVSLIQNLIKEHHNQTGFSIDVNQMQFAYTSFLQKGMAETYKGRIKTKEQLFAKLFQWIGHQVRYDTLSKIINQPPQWQNLSEYLQGEYKEKDFEHFKKTGQLDKWSQEFEKNRFKLTNIAKSYDNDLVTAMFLFEISYLPFGKKLGGSSPDRKLEAFKIFFDSQNKFQQAKGNMKTLLKNKKS